MYRSWWIAISIGFLTLVVLGFCGRAHAECMMDWHEVKEIHGSKADAKFSHHLKGHVGEKCWYAVGFRDANSVAHVPLPKPNSSHRAPSVRMEENAPAPGTFASRWPTEIKANYPLDPLLEDLMSAAGWEDWLHDSMARADVLRSHAQR